MHIIIPDEYPPTYASPEQEHLERLAQHGRVTCGGDSEIGGIFCFESPIAKWLAVRPDLTAFEPEAAFGKWR
jgi:hypothetical protein